MVYTVIAENGRSYDLPGKTISTMEKLDKALRIDSEKGLNLKQKYQKLLDFVKDLIGSENVKEIFGSVNVQDIDVGELEILILKIKDAYDNPASEYQLERMKNAFDGIPTEKIQAITEATKAIR